MKIGLGVLGLGALAYFLTRPKARSVGSTAQGLVASSLTPSPDVAVEGSAGGGGGSSPASFATPQPAQPVAVAQPAPPVVAEPEKLSPVRPAKTLVRFDKPTMGQIMAQKKASQSVSTASTDKPTFKTASPAMTRGMK